MGNKNAPVTLVEYGDFECPFCGEAYPILRKIIKEEDGSLRFIFRYFPLGETHPHAIAAAKASEAASLQGKFWEMHNILFENQESLEEEDLVYYAKKLGLNTDRFIADMESEGVEKRVEGDFVSGVKSGVNGTPTFFINGERYEGSYADGELAEAIREAQGKQLHL